MPLFYQTDNQQLDKFINQASQAAGSEFAWLGSEYLQSWAWGEILKAEGETIIRVGWRAENENKILAAATLVKKSLGAGYYYWYAPRGPIFNIANQAEAEKARRDFLGAIKGIDPKALFLRIEPNFELDKNKDLKKDLSVKPSLALQPKQTLVLDLKKSAEELLVEMHQKTRYNIRLAEKRGVIIREGWVADNAEFWRLMSLTSERDGFRLHGAEHYKNLLGADSRFIKLFLASYEGRNIAAGLFCFWGGRATYLHGASDNEARNLMAPYLLQWEVIKRAKEAGQMAYDFYGIDEKKWPGVTRFKRGFGGRVINYPGTYDIIFQPAAYKIYSWLRKLRRLV